MELRDYFETTTSSSNSPCLLSTDASSLGSSLVSKTFKQKQSWNEDSSLTAQVLGLAWVCLSVSNTWIPLGMLRSSCCKNGIANPHEICLHFLSALPLFPILPLYCTCKQTWEVLKDLLGISSLRNWDTTLNFPKANFPRPPREPVPKPGLESRSQLQSLLQLHNSYFFSWFLVKGS